MSFGPCMCGDLYCSSCGPAQGNSKCEHCGKWADEGGCDDPEKCAEADKLWCEAYAKQIEDEEKMIGEWEKWRKEHPERD